MKDKYKQLYVAVADLLIELGITPEDLKGLVTKGHTLEMYGELEINGEIMTAKTARKLIDAGVFPGQANWKIPDNVSDSNQEVDKEEQVERIKKSILSKDPYLFTDDAGFLRFDRKKYCDVLATFDKIKSGLAPLSLWSYLREKHPKFLFEQIKDYLFPSN